MNNRTRQQAKCYHRILESGLLICAIVPRNPVTGAPKRMVYINRSELDIYRQIYGDGLKLIGGEKNAARRCR